MTSTTFFSSSVAPAFIIGASVFGIFWGVINALLIKQIDLSDDTPIKKAFEEAQIEYDAENQ